MMLNGANSEMTTFVADPEIDIEYLMFMLNVYISKGTPRWSQRSKSVIFEKMTPGLVFMLEKGYLTSTETDSRDWRLALFAQINDML